jgi:hypothetical protein
MIYVAVYHSYYDKTIEVHLHVTDKSMEDIMREGWKKIPLKFEHREIAALSRDESKFAAHKTFSMKISKTESENERQIKSITRKLKNAGVALPVPSWLVAKIDQLISHQRDYELDGRGDVGTT